MKKLLNLMSLACKLDVFFRERELWELFKSNNKNFEIQFKINSKEVVIYVYYLGDWASEQREVILNELWRNFESLLLGWKYSCKVLNYKSYINNKLISEYTFKMEKNWIFKSSMSSFTSYNNEYFFRSKKSKQKKWLLFFINFVKKIK